jgi:uncharacterized protein (TIGR00369 family)
MNQPGGTPPAPPFNDFLGIRVLKREGGRGVAALELKAHHKNRRGVAHGGVVSSLLDSALGAAVISAMDPEEWCATLQLSVSFVSGPREGEIIASGQLVRRGKRLAFAEGELRDGRGRVLATAQGVWHIWPHRPDQGSSPAPE